MAGVDDEIRGLVAAGEKIEAIRLYREHYGADLSTARQAVEAIGRGGAYVSDSHPLLYDEELLHSIDGLLRNGEKIQAIRLLRQRSNLDLKGAKEWVDRREAELGLPRSGACFIATAAFGSPLAPDVQVLRRYRDERLSRSATGRLFIRCYYRLSPPVARGLERSETARLLVRRLLKPLAAACRGTLR